MPGIPMTAVELTGYPDDLAEPRPEGKPSPTSLRLLALMRAEYEKD